jgi:dimethylhistidine N-methyltransferase
VIGAGAGTWAAEAPRTETEQLLEDVLGGLAGSPKRTPPKWLYDERGCELYARITELPEYYLTRTEAAILDAHLGEIADAIGPDALVFEYGAGAGAKALRLLGALDRPAAYVPVEIARPALLAGCEAVLRRFPALAVRPVWADFTAPFELPDADLAAARRVAFFPGSTIGNFDPHEAVALLHRMAAHAGAGGRLVVGVDLAKEAAILERAYDDAQGVTAAFDLNLLARVNRELGGDADLEAFRHVAFFDPRRSRVEMHLQSLAPQVVHVAGRAFAFRQGETIHTESSYKWEARAFDALAAIAGWRHERTFTDERAWYAVKVYSR